MKIELELDDPKRLWADLHAAIDACGNGDVSNRLRVVRTQVYAQLPKPRIPEPGKWGVVEARQNNENPLRRRYVHTDPDEWVCVESGYFYSWPDLIDPVLIREGI